MHIMLTNDDGIRAAGLRELSKAAVAAGHRVTIFAPDGERSAAGHSITIKDPIRVARVPYDGVAAYTTSGTPTDCARLGLHFLRDDKPDCVLSGINKGANRGAAILSSGTVGAALEASLCGVPSAAVSLCKFADDGYEHAARLGIKLAEWMMNHPLPLGEVYNLNVPYGMKPLGVRAASVSYDYVFEPVYRQTDAGWVMVVGENCVPETDENSDLLLTRAGYASLSIVSWNLQAATPLPNFDELNEGL